MTCKRNLAIGLVAGFLIAVGPVCLAQEEVPGDEEQKGKKKIPFGLYVEAYLGSSEADPISAAIETRTTETARSLLDLDDNAFARVAIGWQLPKDRGRFLVRLDGFKEDSYSFVSEGFQSRAVGTNELVEGPVRWWTVSVEDGRQTASRNPPMWVESEDDADQDRSPDVEEIRYAENPDLVLVGPAPENLENRLQTVDLLYTRGFGGRTIGARWHAGLRYLVYEGNIPAGAWLELPAAGTGFTNGGVLPLLSFRQDASGGGLAMGMELQERFFRERLVLYQQARAALLVQSVETDSGEFFTLAPDAVAIDTYIPVASRLTFDQEKSAWNTALEVGARVRLLEGFHFHLAFNMAAYQDAIVLPVGIVIPETEQQGPRGASGVFKTKDILMEGVFAGVSFQF